MTLSTRALVAVAALLPALASGQWFYRVIARDDAAPASNWQVPWDDWTDPETDERVDGILAFEVP